MCGSIRVMCACSHVTQSVLYCLFFNVLCLLVLFFFLMIRRPPRSTRTDTLFPYTTLFRSGLYACGNDMASVMADSYPGPGTTLGPAVVRSEAHTSELQSLMRISYAVFCLHKKTHRTETQISLSHSNH